MTTGLPIVTSRPLASPLTSFAHASADAPPEPASTGAPATQGTRQTLANMARQPPGQHAAAAASTPALALTPAQAKARQHNEALRQRLDPADWAEVRHQIEHPRNFGAGAFRDGIVHLSPDTAKQANKPTRKLNAGPTPDANARMDPAAAERINTAQGTQIDFNQLARYEGGQAVQGYVPWWPRNIQVSPHGAITVDETKTRLNGRDMLKGANQSGVTVGTGVDLGQQRKQIYIPQLQAFGVSSDLIDRLTPYMELKRGQAAEYLRAHPLTITKAEADLLDAEMKNQHLKDTIREYDELTTHLPKRRTFTQLSAAEQTVLFSRHYQDGNIRRNPASREIATALAEGRVQDALDRLTTSHYSNDAHHTRVPQERNYLNAWFQTIDAQAYRVQP